MPSTSYTEFLMMCIEVLLSQYCKAVSNYVKAEDLKEELETSILHCWDHMP